MKFVSWNVNGLRSILNKNFDEVFKNMNADFFCMQEIKLQENMIELEKEGYYSYWNYAEKKGYSGTAIFTKIKPVSVHYGMNNEEYDKEGRIITLEYENFYIINVYVPNSQSNLTRLNYRLEWGDLFYEYIKELNYIKPIIICGDFNVAHTEIDLKYPEKNIDTEGFTNEEREQFNELLNLGLIDSYRYKYPTRENAYSWWSYRHNGKATDNGWRLDYFLVSDILKDRIINAQIRKDIGGSDHCPIVIKIKL